MTRQTLHHEHMGSGEGQIKRAQQRQRGSERQTMGEHSERERKTDRARKKE